MIIEYHPSFKKSYQRRIARHERLVERVAERLLLFQKQRNHPLLKDHALTGKKLRLRAFSITGDLRVVYLPISEDHVVLLDIGTHNQVY